MTPRPNPSAPPSKTSEAVFWDNDGTLVDSEAIFFEITRDAFARLGIILTKEIWGSHYLGEGKTSRELALSLGADRDKLKTVLEERNHRYQQLLNQPPPLRPEVRETLSALAGRVRMALVTGCHRDQLRLMHAATGLLQFFEVIVTGDQTFIWQLLKNWGSRPTAAWRWRTPHVASPQPLPPESGASSSQPILHASSPFPAPSQSSSPYPVCSSIYLIFLLLFNLPRPRFLGSGHCKHLQNPLNTVHEDLPNPRHSHPLPCHHQSRAFARLL